VIEQQPVPGIMRDGSTPAATSSSSSIARSSSDSEFAPLFRISDPVQESCSE
jgi:hypothetical protein